MQTTSTNHVGAEVRQATRLGVLKSIVLAHPRAAFVLVWTVLFLVRALLYLALIPPWQAPDEPTSFEVLLTMQQEGRLVSLEDRDPAIQRRIVDSMVRSHYWELGGFAYGLPKGSAWPFDDVYGPGATQLHRPALYQLVLFPFAQALRDLPLEHQLIILRGVNLVFGIVTMATVALMSYELRVIHPAIPLVLPALIAFHPQFAYTSATFAADNLAATLGALIFFTMMRVTQRGLSPGRILVFPVLLGLGLLVKRTILFLPPPVLLLVMIETWLGFRHRRFHRRGCLFAAAIGLLVLAIAGIAIRSPDAARAFINRHIVIDNLQHVIWLLVYSPMPIDILQTIVLPFLNMSFWGSYGWHHVGIAAPIAKMLLMAVIGSWLACAVVLVARFRLVPAWARRFALICAFAVLTALFITIRYTDYPTLPQGRYLFPVIIPIFLLMSIGISGWWGRHMTKYGVVLAWAALIALDLYTLLYVFIPGFYP